MPLDLSKGGQAAIAAVSTVAAASSSIAVHGVAHSAVA